MSSFGPSLISKKTKGILASIFILSFLIAVIPLVLIAVREPHELRMLAGPLGDPASLSLSASSSSIAVNGTTTVSVRLNTGGRGVDAVDVVMTFNSSFLNLQSITPNTATNFKTFVPWQSGAENFDSAAVISGASDGNFEFGAVTFDSGSLSDPNDGNITSPVNGSDILIAELVFRGVANGTSQISFVYNNSEATTDTNVVSHDANNVDDILQAPTPIIINVGVAGCEFKTCGDADCVNGVTMNDFGILRDEIRGIDVSGATANFDDSLPTVDAPLGVTMNDFGILRDGIRCVERCNQASNCL